VKNINVSLFQKMLYNSYKSNIYQSFDNFITYTEDQNHPPFRDSCKLYIIHPSAMSKNIIEKFYDAFARHDAQTMGTCYHPEAEFHDPAFGLLKGEEIPSMWHMLLERSKGQLRVEASDIRMEGNIGKAQWQATYSFGKAKRKVVNQIEASFEFKDGLFYRHTDRFSMWRWSRQALGLSGWLLGWTPLIRKKVQLQTKGLLRDYMSAR
jgi:hypothetical protein